MSQKAAWKRFVERRRTELHAAYPCAAPTYRKVCPKHRVRIGPVTGICKPCRDELFERLAAEYVNPTDPKEVTSMTSTELAEREPEIIDGEIATAAAPAPFNLFGTTDPDLVIAQAAKVARALEKVIRQQNLYVTIRGKEYVKVEGLTLLGTMLGVFPFTVWTREIDGGWEARVEARTLDGRAVGSAESMCTRAEARWRGADEYAVRSMAATRATAKALRQSLGFFMPLAHFEETPADEIPQDEPRAAAAVEQEPRSKIPEGARPSSEQIAELRRLLAELHELDPRTDWHAAARAIAGCPGDQLTRGGAAMLLDELRALLAKKEAA